VARWFKCVASCHRGAVYAGYMPHSGAFMLPGRRYVYVAGSPPPIVPLRKGDSWACGKRNGRARPAAIKTVERALRRAKRWTASRSHRFNPARDTVPLAKGDYRGS
jgi:hypothetical protein